MTNAAVRFASRLMDGERAHALCHDIGPRGFTGEHHTDPEALAARALVLTDEGANVWVSAHPLKAIPTSGRGGAEDVAGVSWLHADLDWRGEGHAKEDLPTEAEVRKGLSDFAAAYSLLPTVLVHSGHGLQAWWEMEEEMAPADGAAMLLRLHAGLRRCGLMPERHDLASVLRLPGTVNYKGEPVPVVIEHDNGASYSTEYLDALPEVEAPTPSTLPEARGEWSTATLAVDRYNLHPDAGEVIAQLLVEMGWREGRPDRAGVRYFTRPGKDDGISATLGKVAPGVLYCFTSSAEGFDAERTYDASDVLAIAHHGGDRVAMDAALHAKGWGASLYGAGLFDLGEAEPPRPTWDPSLFLPEEFWTARPIHEQVRQAAQARRVAPDAVLGSLLTRIAAFSGHRTSIPPLVGTPVGLTLYVGLVGPPESGKSTATKLAKELLPVPDGQDIPDGQPIGTGEGFVEVLYTSVPDPDNPKQRVRMLTRHAAIFHIDEGTALATMGNRKDAVLLPTLRTAFTHGNLGQANASAEKRRVAPAGSYVYGITMGIQPSEAGPLLADAGAGTPQRFVWLMSTDPLAPTVKPEDPAPIEWDPYVIAAQLEVAEDAERRLVGFDVPRSEQLLQVPDEVRAEVDADRLDALHGLTVRPLSDAHTMLVRLKVAALLGILDGRANISMEDWHLAALVVRTSKAVRRACEATIKKQDEERRSYRNRLQAEDAVEVAEVVARTATEQAAASLLAHLRGVRHEDGSSCSCGSKAIKKGAAREAWQEDKEAVMEATKGAAYLDADGHPRLT